MPVQSLLRTVLFSDDLSRKLVVEQHPEDGGFGWWLYKLDRHNRSSLLLSILESAITRRRSKTANGTYGNGTNATHDVRRRRKTGRVFALGREWAKERAEEMSQGDANDGQRRDLPGMRARSANS